VHILGTIEAGRAAGADAIGAQGLDGLVLERVGCEEVVEVVRGKVGDSAAVGKPGFGASGPARVSK